MALLLREVSVQDFQQLSQCIWNWEFCGHCSGDKACLTATCSWSRARRLDYFWDRYRDVTEAYVPELSSATPALTSHHDLLEVIRSIRTHPNWNREQLMQHNFVDGVEDTASCAAVSDQSRAMNIAASLLFLTNCGTPLECAEFLEDDSPSFSWRGNLTASAFVDEAYPAYVHPYFDRGSDSFKAPDVLSRLAATRLVRLGLKFEPTNDLRSHLRLDHARRTIQVFHGSAVLKETLLATREDLTDCAMPRAIALEALDNIHQVLFPANRKSYALLHSLTSKHGFDKDLLHYESAQYRREDDQETSYEYFGIRLAEIYDEIQNPTPHGRLENWLERKSGTRYMLLATMIGVFIAVILGFLSLGVAMFQAWVAYQQWKHPVKET
ncbi:hypothetical protein CC86DRAFT_355267 [Ophiobolus disseminans]|uniref:Uncharacterized protein n=1 Tax=Ophiobolus disseminans TaxID=1469910 RepID=A0A6A6ZTJ3_9PLEO|nr:hypothetical protein CC86DRAFT_355267 [Ophiobolus disseminans]